MSKYTLKVALAQIAPIWLDKKATLAKVLQTIENAGAGGCELIVFGEGLLPGYPWWLSITHASAWDDPIQKEIHAHYAKNSVQIEQGDLSEIQEMAKKHRIAVYLGIIERPQDLALWSISILKEKLGLFTESFSPPTTND